MIKRRYTHTERTHFMFNGRALVAVWWGYSGDWDLVDIEGDDDPSEACVLAAGRTCPE